MVVPAQLVHFFEIGLIKLKTVELGLPKLETLKFDTLKLKAVEFETVSLERKKALSMTSLGLLICPCWFGCVDLGLVNLG